MKELTTFLLFFLSFTALAQTPSDKTAIAMVPGGTVKYQITRYSIETPKGSIVELDFTQEGKFIKASGGSLENDILNIGKSGVSFTQAVEAVKKEGRTFDGEWDLQLEKGQGWVYVFSGSENGKENSFRVSAKTGKFVEN